MTEERGTAGRQGGPQPDREQPRPPEAQREQTRAPEAKREQREQQRPTQAKQAHPEQARPAQGEQPRPPQLDQTSSEQPHRRSWARWVWWTLAVGSTLGVALRWMDLTWGGLIPVAQTFVPLAGIVAILLGVWAFAAKWKNATLFILPAVLAWTFSTLPDFVVGTGSKPSFPHGRGARPDPHGTSRTLTVLSANLHVGQADPKAVVEAVQELKPEVVVFTEATPATVQALRAAGLPAQLANATNVPSSQGVTGSVVLTSLPLSQTGVLRPSPETFEQPYGTVTVCGTPVSVLGVHTSPPVPGLAHLWRPTLQAVGDWGRGVKEVGKIRPTILAGDFNASLDHPALRKETRSFLDAHATRGQGWVTTWPIGRKTPPFVHLDHVFVRHLGVDNAGTVELPGSDHRAVWARLRVGCSAPNN